MDIDHSWLKLQCCDLVSAFYKSVHLGGDGVEAEMVEAKKRAKQEWLDAVMVDNIHFNTHYGEKGIKPSQLGKLDGILDGG